MGNMQYGRLLTSRTLFQKGNTINKGCLNGIGDLRVIKRMFMAVRQYRIPAFKGLVFGCYLIYMPVPYLKINKKAARREDSFFQ